MKFNEEYTNQTPVETGFKPVSTATIHGLSEIIRAFKTFTARKINNFQKTPGLPFWQQRYYDRIIRNEKELNNIRQYIIDNPKNWERDELNS